MPVIGLRHYMPFSTLGLCEFKKYKNDTADRYSVGVLD
jgi:hypothetical protein